MCLSSVYKEKAFGEQDVGVIFLNGWVAVFQTVMSLPLAIPSRLGDASPVVGAAGQRRGRVFVCARDWECGRRPTGARVIL